MIHLHHLVNGGGIMHALRHLFNLATNTGVAEAATVGAVAFLVVYFLARKVTGSPRAAAVVAAVLAMADVVYANTGTGAARKQHALIAYGVVLGVLVMCAVGATLRSNRKARQEG